MNLSSRSSTRLIWMYFISCTVVFAMLVGANEWLIRSKVLPGDTFKQYVALFAETTSPHVAFGDSKMARGFDAQEPVVNLAYPTENIEKIAWKSGLYLDKIPAPKTIFIQADPHLFSRVRTKEGLGEYRYYFENVGWPRLISMSDRYRPQLIALWKALYRGRGSLNSNIITTSQGALLSPGNLATWSDYKVKDYLENRLTRHRPLLNFQNSLHAQRYRETVQKFVNAGANVCLIILPTSSAYRDYVTLMDGQLKMNWEKAEAFFMEIAELPNITLVDHRSEIENPAMFRDPDHLNMVGAKKYGLILQSACADNSGS